jgi:rRNA-processing protein FCF1
MDANALMMPVECDLRVFEELDRLLADEGVGSHATGPVTSEAAGTVDPAHTVETARTDGPGKTGGPDETDGVAAPDGEAATPDGDEVTEVVDGHELVVPRAVLAELERLADGAGEAATAASVGLDLARERCRVLDHEADSGDAAVFECGIREDVTHVVTNDGPLRDRLLDAGVPVISLRARNKLAVTQP